MVLRYHDKTAFVILVHDAAWPNTWTLTAAILHRLAKHLLIVLCVLRAVAEF
jgi:hypothetical protein